MLIISEWRTDEWRFKSRNPEVNEFKSITLLTNDWDMEVNYGIPNLYNRHRTKFLKRLAQGLVF